MTCLMAEGKWRRVEKKKGGLEGGTRCCFVEVYSVWNCLDVFERFMRSIRFCKNCWHTWGMGTCTESSLENHRTEHRNTLENKRPFWHTVPVRLIQPIMELRGFVALVLGELGRILDGPERSEWRSGSK